MTDREDQIKELKNVIKGKDRDIAERDHEIDRRDRQIDEQNEEIRRLQGLLANGDANSTALSKALEESQQKLKDALARIDELERTLQRTVNDNELECTRLNTEIDRLNTILKATNGNM